jgi:hypothetical protein
MKHNDFIPIAIRTVKNFNPVRKSLFFIPFFFLFACDSDTTSPTGEPGTGSGGETESESSPIQLTTTITKENAADVKTFDNTPESVVMYFYASRIRGDKEWEKVIQQPDERSDRMNRKLEDYAQWTILEYKFVSKVDKGDDRAFVKLWMKINVEGETDEGEDEAEVELIDGKWLITSIPT